MMDQSLGDKHAYKRKGRAVKQKALKYWYLEIWHLPEVRENYSGFFSYFGSEILVICYLLILTNIKHHMENFLGSVPGTQPNAQY